MAALAERLAEPAEPAGVLEGTPGVGAAAEPALFVTAVGAGTTYPDYKPAPFIVGSRHEGVDMVTVVTEGIFSYCGVKVKIDTDRFLGPERSLVRVEGGDQSTYDFGPDTRAMLAPV